MTSMAMKFTLEWNDPHDAEEVAHVLMAAAVGTNGRVKDHGFYDDAKSLFDQVEAFYDEQLAKLDRPGLRIAVRLR